MIFSRCHYKFRLGLRLLFWILLLGLAVSYFQRDDLPPPEELRPELSRPPVQEPVEEEPFTARAAGHTYTIEPLYSYELTGLVVSAHDADSWFDYYHDLWNDTLNTKDLCVIWGDNALSGIYQDFSFRNGSFTCYYQPDSSSAFQAFRSNEFANNHLLAVSDSLRNALADIRPGDQIRFRGYLANYRYPDGGIRRTSTTRDDTGANACETVFVTEVEVLRAANVIWREVFSLSFLVLVLVVALRLGLFWWCTKPRRRAR